MKGLSENTLPVFNFVKDLDILEDYFLIGGTALSLQIGHRLSEDLDFGKWMDNPSLKKKEVDWPRIETALKVHGEVSTEVIDLNQAIFHLNSIKVEFYANGICNSREISSDTKIGNVILANAVSIGTMKLELLLRRNVFRDYYDIYSILQEGYKLKDLVERCGRYSKHRMKTKTILAILAEHGRFEYEEGFDLLGPRYQVSSEEIGAFMKEIILKEYGR